MLIFWVYSLFYSTPDTKYEKSDFYAVQPPNHLHGNNLNINLPENNAVLRLEVELRDKNTRHRHHNQGGVRKNGQQSLALKDDTNNYIVPMEKVSIRLCHETGKYFMRVDIFLSFETNKGNTEKSFFRFCKMRKQNFSCAVRG